MILDNKTKKYFKIICLVLFVVALTGCTANLDSSGKLIAKRAINLNTPWSMKSGIFDFLLVIPISKSIIYLGDVLLNNIALGVVLITILINIIILPIMIKSTVSQQKMQLIQPEMERIQNKYKGRKDQTSQMRMSAEIQALYKKNDVSMLASFTTFLTLPIMFAMWQAVQRIEILYQTNMFGINLGAKPIDHVFKFEIAYIVLLAIVALTQYFAMKINTIMSKRNPKYRETSQMQSMNMMNNFMTLFIIYFAAIMPAAMSLYWMTTNIITIVRTWYIYIYHVEKAQKEVETMIREEGEAAVLEVGIHGIHPELVRLLGKMKYRTSYGQNALKHSIEVAQLTGLLAAEIGEDVRMAKRAGLLHDIGKAVDHDMEGSHIQLGVELCRKYKESPLVINAVEAHRGDVEPESLIACLVQAADTISAARPGARKETLETYSNRLQQLEDITNSYKGVEKSFAVQAGREVRIIVQAEMFDDLASQRLARDVAKRIEDELDYPGQIRVTVVREFRTTEIAK